MFIPMGRMTVFLIFNMIDPSPSSFIIIIIIYKYCCYSAKWNRQWSCSKIHSKKERRDQKMEICFRLCACERSAPTHYSFHRTVEQPWTFFSSSLIRLFWTHSKLCVCVCAWESARLGRYRNVSNKDKCVEAIRIELYPIPMHYTLCSYKHSENRVYKLTA